METLKNIFIASCISICLLCSSCMGLYAKPDKTSLPLNHSLSRSFNIDPLKLQSQQPGSGSQGDTSKR